jgi:lipopolysaccharide transport system ATP-binding protein
MTSVAICVENLGKSYRIGGVRPQGRSLREALTAAVTAPFRRAVAALAGRAAEASEEEIWALKSVSFEVARGEVVGVIGRNGAGKSTLLKILSRITEPTEGRVGIRGRVGSLLEVGTGFHRELTGRENVFLNGAMLGMRRAEIERKFDEIVAFAEIERFLETPVKRYSSGMYMRLAFAVAAHLDPDVLLVDEILSVGDAQFQKKCLGKMEDVAKHGRTVLFVSHHLPSISRLCRSAILLDGGQLVEQGDVHAVTSRYLRVDGDSMAVRVWNDPRSAPGDEVARLLAVRVLQHGEVTETVDIRHPARIEMDYLNLKDNARLLFSFSIFNDQGVFLFAVADLDEAQGGQPRAPGVYRAIGEIPGNLLSEGTMRIAAEVSTRAPLYQIHFVVHDAVAFQVVDSGEPGSVRAGWGRPLPGVVRPACLTETRLLRSGVE